MDVLNTNAVNGSLQISSEVIAKIARLAALEVEGVADVTAGNTGVKGLLGKVTPQKAVSVSLLEDVAEITVSLQVKYATKIPSVCEKVQQNVKAAVQNMTSITVSRVNIVVTGVELPQLSLSTEQAVETTSEE